MSANRLRAVPWALGVCLLVGSIVGANRLLHPTDAKSPTGGDGGPPKHAPTAGSPALPGGTVVLGTVDSDPPPVQVGPPNVAALVTVESVPVVDGQEVKAGDVLVRFENRVAAAKVKQAQAQLAAAESELAEAKILKTVQAVQVERQQAAVKAADEQLGFAEQLLKVGKEQFDRTLESTNPLTGRPLTEAEKATQRRENSDIRKGEMQVAELRARAEDEKKKLKALELSPTDLKIAQVAAKVDAVRAVVAEAEAGLDGLVVRAKIGGVVEQVTAAPGATYGPSSRTPLMYLIPAGPRVVRAEVEAEFAYKIADKVGKPVLVYDHNNFALTYPGVVKRIGSSYLSKRSAADTLAVNPSKVLECLIDVPDPTPAGKPPLRVGQPVRVSFP